MASIGLAGIERSELGYSDAGYDLLQSDLLELKEPTRPTPTPTSRGFNRTCWN